MMDPRKILHTCLLIIWLMTLETRSQRQKNVLFISVDDLRPELGIYQDSSSSSFIRTPHIDELGSKSMVMKRAYVQQAVCGPSRASYLTGRRPETTKVHTNQRLFRDYGGDFATIPQYFKDHGYATIGVGKVFHHTNFSTPEAIENDPVSWSEPYLVPQCFWRSYNISWRAITPDETEECLLSDVDVAYNAIRSLERFASGGDLEGKIFFLAGGFYKPHMPWTFPEEYLDMYPLEDIPLPDNRYAPIGMPEVAWFHNNETRIYEDVKVYNSSGAMNDTLPEEAVRLLRRGYFATVSFIDDQVGRIMNELKVFGLEDDTIVSFIGDHGWKLGEHGGWSKQCNLEVTVRAPMMIRVPGYTDQGLETHELAEFVDLFPTLVEAAGLPALKLCPEDSSAVYVCTEGMSLMPLIRQEETTWKDRAFSWYPRYDNTVMGHTMRTKQYRYTEWPSFNEDTYEVDWDDLYGVELYDHMVDPQENHNVAYESKYAVTRDELSAKLRAGWREYTYNRSTHSVIHILLLSFSFLLLLSTLLN